MTAKKWRLVEGHVYKLSDVFHSCVKALHHAKILNREHHAILTKTSDGNWAVYWRTRSEVQCAYKIEENSSMNTS